MGFRNNGWITQSQNDWKLCNEINNLNRSRGSQERFQVMAANTFQEKNKKNSSLTFMSWETGRALEIETAGVPERAEQEDRWFLPTRLL